MIPTAARALGGRWEMCALVLANGARVPVIGAAFVEERGAEQGVHFGAVFARSGFTSAGGESIDIAPLAPAPSKTPGLSGRIGSP